MNVTTRKIGVAALVLVSCAAAAMTAAARSDDDDPPLRGSNLDRAATAALEHVGGGTVLETEVGDDGAAYGVEIRLDDGSVLEVSLDAEFNPIDTTADDDGPNDAEEDSESG